MKAELFGQLVQNPTNSLLQQAQNCVRATAFQFDHREKGYDRKSAIESYKKNNPCENLSSSSLLLSDFGVVLKGNSSWKCFAPALGFTRQILPFDLILADFGKSQLTKSDIML